MTALMAFFLVMWLITATDEQDSHRYRELLQSDAIERHGHEAQGRLHHGARSEKDGNHRVIWTSPVQSRAQRAARRFLERFPRRS